MKLYLSKANKSAGGNLLVNTHWQLSAPAQSRLELESELYGQLREVERCLERFPGQLPQAVHHLVRLVREYNPELTWDNFGPHRIERMGEPWP